MQTELTNMSAPFLFRTVTRETTQAASFSRFGTYSPSGYKQIAGHR